MSINNVDLSVELLSMIGKMYPNGTTLTIINGAVEVKLPQVAKKVIPAPVKKLQSNGNIKYITDAEIYWDGDHTFYFTSDEYSYHNMSLYVKDSDFQGLVDMLRDGEGTTEEVSLEVEIVFQEGSENYANFIQ